MNKSTAHLIEVETEWKLHKKIKKSKKNKKVIKENKKEKKGRARSKSM